MRYEAGTDTVDRRMMNRSVSLYSSALDETRSCTGNRKSVLIQADMPNAKSFAFQT